MTIHDSTTRTAEAAKRPDDVQRGRRFDAALSGSPVEAKGVATRRRLRLAPGPQRDAQTAAAVGSPIEGFSDPRWVLAVRTAEQLEGPVLRPEKRDRLVRLGKLLGLTAFDANLVIAIMQDQARRGYAPESCPAAGEQQLRMVPLRNAERQDTAARKKRVMAISFIISALVGVEVLILRWLMM